MLFLLPAIVDSIFVSKLGGSQRIPPEHSSVEAFMFDTHLSVWDDELLEGESSIGRHTEGSLETFFSLNT